MKQFPERKPGNQYSELEVAGADNFQTRRKAATDAGMSERQQILDMYLRCYQNDVIAEAVDKTPQRIGQIFGEYENNSNFANSLVFDNFKPEIYTSAPRARA